MNRVRSQLDYLRQAAQGDWAYVLFVSPADLKKVMAHLERQKGSFQGLVLFNPCMATNELSTFLAEQKVRVKYVPLGVESLSVFDESLNLSTWKVHPLSKTILVPKTESFLKNLFPSTTKVEFY